MDWLHGADSSQTLRRSPLLSFPWGRTDPRTSRPLPLLRLDRDLDFAVKDHENQKQDQEMTHHPLSLQWLAGGAIPAGFPTCRPKDEESVDAWRFGSVREQVRVFVAQQVQPAARRQEIVAGLGQFQPATS